LAQSKWINSGSGEPEAKDITVFANGIKDLVEQEHDNFTLRLHSKLTEINQYIVTPGTKIHAVLVFTGASEISSPSAANLVRVIRELNGADQQDPIATDDVIGLAKIYDALARNASQDGIVLDLNLLDWSQVSQPYTAYFGVVDGLQLKGWWTIHNKRLLAKNIRNALGLTDVNNQIRTTATTNPEHFWYFNNGITLIADDVLKAPVGAAARASGNFQLRGASIVNGAQTVSTLGKIENDVALGRVRVPLRVILLSQTPERFGEEVTKNNNIQNRIEARDFAAHDPEQNRIQMEMRIEGVEYQFLRSEDFVPSQASCEDAYVDVSGDHNI